MPKAKGKKGELPMEQRRYQLIENGERYLLVDEGTWAKEKKVTPNLIKGEIKILGLNAKDCPLNRECVYLEGKRQEEVSSICKYLGLYDNLGSPIPCEYKGHSERELKTFLPKYDRNKILHIMIPIDPAYRFERSHAYFVCKE